MPDDTKKPGPDTKGPTLVATVPAQSGQLTVPAPRVQPPPESPTPQNRSRWIWASLGAVTIVAAALWFFQPWATKGLPVKVESAIPGSLTRVLAVNGRIAPLHLVDVKPKVGGEVISVLVEEGTVVRQGDILAELDASGQQAVVRQALAGLDAASVAQMQAKANLTRAGTLGSNITKAALEDAQTASRTADQEVARLAAVFDQARIELEKYTLTAPVAGTVLTRNAEIGQATDLTKALFSVADLGQLVVETDVDESYATQVTLDLPAVLQLKGETTRRDGSVSFVAAQVDAATGGLAIKIAFDDPVTAPVGLTVTANIIVDRQDAAIAVPRAAVVREATSAVVFVVEADKAERRDVTVVDWPADRVEVTTGLVAGDIVITDATGLSDGMAITVTTAATADP